VAFDPESGKQVWKAASGSGGSTPAIGAGRIFVAAWSPFGESDHTPPLPDFDELLKSDANGDGRIDAKEFPADVYLFRRPNVNVTGSAVPIKGFFARLDADKDGRLDRGEWDNVREQLGRARQQGGHGLTAIEPSGEVVWKEARSVPEVPSPLFYNGRVYMVTHGGIVTCMDAASGKVLYRGRLNAPGAYFASPVAANGRIYFASAEGMITVLKENGEGLTILARNEMGEPISATPAICGRRLVVRTATHLYAFADAAGQ
jgi:outer membrane protein assembly factor BamB